MHLANFTRRLPDLDVADRCPSSMEGYLRPRRDAVYISSTQMPAPFIARVADAQAHFYITPMRYNMLARFLFFCTEACCRFYITIRLRQQTISRLQEFLYAGRRHCVDTRCRPPGISIHMYDDARRNDASVAKVYFTARTQRRILARIPFRLMSLANTFPELAHPALVSIGWVAIFAAIMSFAGVTTDAPYYVKKSRNARCGFRWVLLLRLFEH